MNRQKLDALFGDNLQDATPRMLGAVLVVCLVLGTLAWLLAGL